MDYAKLIVLIAQDYTNNQIAKEMCYSPHYVKECVAKLIYQYDCRSRCGIYLKALKKNNRELLDYLSKM
jgi:DNA-binding CsgD family transcriptional regulator